MLTFYLSMVQSDEDKKKIEFVYNEFYSLMCVISYDILKNTHDAEDIAQSCILKIVENPDIIDITNVNRARGLCCIMSKNKSIDFLRLKKNHSNSLEDAAECYFQSSDDVATLVINQETYNFTMNVINSLNDTYRNVCLLKYAYGYKEREIATILELSPNVVNQRIYHAIKKNTQKITFHHLIGINAYNIIEHTSICCGSTGNTYGSAKMGKCGKHQYGTWF